MTSVILAVALLSGCAYRVKTETGQDDANNSLKAEADVVTEGGTLEEQVFYDAEVIPLMVPQTYNGTIYNLFYTETSTPVFLDKWIIVPMCRYYTDAEAEQSSIWGPNLEMLEQTYAIYDLAGNYISSLAQQSQVMDKPFFVEDESGNIIAIYSYLNAEYYEDETVYSEYGVCAMRFSPSDGGLLEGPISLCESVSSPLTGVIATDGSRIVFSTEHEIVEADLNGEVYGYFELESGSICVGLWKEDGQGYTELISSSSGEETGVLLSFEYTQDGGFSLNVNGKITDNLAGMKIFQNRDGLYAATSNALGKLDLKSGQFSRLLDWNQTDVDRSMLVNGNVRVLQEGELSQTTTVLPYVDGGVEQPEEAPAYDVNSEPVVAQASEPGNATKETTDSESATVQTRLLIATTMHGESGDVPCLVKLVPADTNPHAGQNVVWVGGVGISTSPIMSLIAKFNQSGIYNTWVKVYDYADFSSYDNELEEAEAYEAALENMAAQVRSGVGPDIILGAGESGIFDNGTCLTDLNGYVDSLRGIERSRYFDTVFRAFETNGKLYQIPLAFTVYAVLGNRYFTDGKEEMNYSDYTSARAFIPDSVSLMSYYPTDILLALFTKAETATWIDYENGTAYADRQSLINMLEMLRVNSFDAGVFSYEGITNLYQPNTVESIDWMYNGYSAFAPGRIDTISDYALFRILGDQLSWYAFPGSEGCTSVVQADLTCGIASGSTQKEQAWEVIRYLLSEDVQKEIGKMKSFAGLYQSTFESRIPVHIDAFEKLSAESIPSDGKMITLIPDYYGEGNYVKVDLGSFDTAKTSFYVMMAMPQRRYISDIRVIEMVRDIAELYINGEITVAEAADTIQHNLAEIAAG